MTMHSSRRTFLAGGLGLAAAYPAQIKSQADAPLLSYRTLGKTGLKISTLGFGCMITSDISLIKRAAALAARRASEANKVLIT